MNKSAFAAGVAALLLSVAPLAAPAPGAMHAKAAKAAKADVMWPADAIKWEDGPAKGTHVAKLWGDWQKGGPYGVLIKFDAGVMHPLHHHTQSLRIVVISGTFIHQPEGGEEARFGPGSYVMQMGGRNHVSGCSPEAECEFFMSANNKFDMINAPEEKK